MVHQRCSLDLPFLQKAQPLPGATDVHGRTSLLLFIDPPSIASVMYAIRRESSPPPSGREDPAAHCTLSPRATTMAWVATQRAC